MPKLRFLTRSTNSKLVPLYIRFTFGHKGDIWTRSGFLLDPNMWSNKTESYRQRILTKNDTKILKRIKEFRDYLESEISLKGGDFNKAWFEETIAKFHKPAKEKSLNAFIDSFITEAGKGNLKNHSGQNFASGTVKQFNSFKLVFNEFQGVYMEKRYKARTEQKKPIRPNKMLDFEDINLVFYEKFKAYLSNDGFALNSTGRFIKNVKFFMQKALNEKLHNNREFDYFAGTSEDTFMIYLTRDEIDKIADLELSDDTLKQVRDAFIVLCETALRVSDYKKVDFNIRSKGSQKLIYLNQTKTGDQVVIPLSTRLEKILLKYNYKLPVLSDQKINFNIKIIARSAGITEIINLEKTKYGKKYQIQKEKCSLVTCHTARRSAATNMFLAGIPAISIMKITGHKSEKSFMRYIRISAEENAVKLYDHPYYSGLKVAK